MKSKLFLGSTLVGIIVLLLTISGGFTQASIVSMNNKEVKTTVDYLIEDMSVIAGIDSAALVKLDLLGGPTPSIVTSPLFDNVVHWGFVLSDQDNFEPYLYRRPFRAPDNFSLVLEIKGSLGETGSLNKAMAVAEEFSLTYDITLTWSGALRNDISGNYIYIFTAGAESSDFTQMFGDIQGDINGGLVSYINSNDVTNSPVKALGFGVLTIEGEAIPVRFVYYVDPNAITGTTEFTLSTENLFGQDIQAFDDPTYLKYSILKFRFPYTINPQTITPETDNFAPQITGKMDWILTPPGGDPDPAMNYEVVYNIDHSVLVSSPRVHVNMGYNQTQLQHDGVLQMNYEVKNTGTEAAKNVTISYPLGPDFQAFINNKPNLWRLRDDVYVDESIHSDINVTVEVNFEGDLFAGYDNIYYDQILLSLDGWYVNKTDSTWVDWNDTLTNVVVKSDTAIFSVLGITGTITSTITLHNPDGLVNTLVAAAINFLAPIDLNDYAGGNWGDIFEDYKDALIDSAADAADTLFHMLYQEQSIFDPDYQDFELVSRMVGERIGERHREYFLETVIPNIDPDQTVNVSWALTNIPAQQMSFGAMRIEPIAVGDSYAIHLNTTQHTFEELMQMLLGFADAAGPLAAGRPLSFYDAYSDSWISVGARFKYSDAEGFEYFGFSNGINFQIADDEAVLNVHVELNSTGYKVGDPVGVSYSIKNEGNTVAANVNLYLFHGRMGADWQIRDPELFYVEEIGDIAPGQTITGTVDVLANTFLGIHPVYAVVEFDSDPGQGPLPVENWFTGDTAFFEGAAETHEIVLSNMDWALLLPKTEGRRPAFPQPILEIETNPIFYMYTDRPWEIEVELTITNAGEEPTTITVLQYYNMSELDLLSTSSTEGSVWNGSYLGMGLIRFENIRLEPGESVTITMRWMFLTSDGCYIPAAQIIYDSRFANELEGDINSEEGGAGGTMLMLLDGESQDTNEWEDYGASTSTGTSAGADIYTGGEEHTRRIGSMDLLYWSVAAILVTGTATIVKRRKKL